MAEWLQQCGTALGFLGAALAVGLPCSGSALGVGTVGRAGAGVLSVDPGKFSRVLILQIIPGTQGLYGLVIWFLALMKLGFLGGGPVVDFTIAEGLRFFGSCMPIAISGLVCGIVMGRLGASGISLLTKRGQELSKSIIIMIMVEFYAIISLLATFMMLNSFKN